MQTPAIDSAVDAYVSRLLIRVAPPEACLDEESFLGPYVTSMLRMSDEEDKESLLELLSEHGSIDQATAEATLDKIRTAVQTGIIPEEPLSEDTTSATPTKTAEILPTTDVPDPLDLLPSPSDSATTQTSELPTTSTSELPSLFSPPNDRGEETSSILWEAAHAQESRHGEALSILSPMKLDNLILGDLMGMLDDPSTPMTYGGTISTISQAQGHSTPTDAAGRNIAEVSMMTPSATRFGSNTSLNEQDAAADAAFPPLGAAVPSSNSASTPNRSGSSKRSKKAGKGKGRRSSSNNNNASADDLAVSLFKNSSTRPRQGSVAESSTSSTATPPATSLPQGSAAAGTSQDEPLSIDTVVMKQQQQQILATSKEWLWSMNPELGEDAITEAIAMAQADVNVAQYIIESALTAPPICRHYLAGDGCYRSDCQFSHDVDGHTCLFWLRGRCGKGATCRFKHGYSTKLLEGIASTSVTGAASTSVSSGVTTLTSSSSGTAMSVPIGSTTATASIASPLGLTGPVAGLDSSPWVSTPPLSSLSLDHNNPFSASSPMLSNTPAWASSTPNFSSTGLEGLMENASITNNNSTSFANIASKPHDTRRASSSRVPSRHQQQVKNRSTATKSQTVKIPQELWNPHVNRNAQAFYITDPMERYRDVMARSSIQNRSDVIDLHFQSIKTFAVVLEEVLHEQLVKNQSAGGEGVWIITGTGSHVGTRTHQKGGGALESAVLEWLDQEGYRYKQGKDRNGQTGAILVLG